MIEILYVKHNWFKDIVGALIPILEQKYNIKINAKPIARKEYNFNFNDTQPWTLLQKCVIFRNIENGLYFILDPHDHANHVLQFIAPLDTDKKFVYLYKVQYDPSLIVPGHPLIAPFTYIPKYPVQYEELRKPIATTVKNIDGLSFAGKEWKGRRKVLNELKDILDSPERMNYPEYLSHLATVKIALSLPGHGNFCHREIEAFGLGTPVLMPTLKNEYADPLVPYKHYIPCNYIATSIRLAYEEWKNDDHLECIAENALDWYENNCTVKSFAKHLSMGMNKILKKA